MTTNMTMNTAQVFRPGQCEAHFHVHNIIKSNVSPPERCCGQMSVLAGLLRIIIILTQTFNHCSSSRHGAAGATLALELETEDKRRFAKFSIVSYSRLSLMIIALASQFYIYLPWSQCLFSIVNSVLIVS